MDMTAIVIVHIATARGTVAVPNVHCHTFVLSKTSSQVAVVAPPFAMRSPPS